MLMILTLVLVLLFGFASPPAAAAGELDFVRLPPGFKIELYARVPRARSMVVMNDWGVVLVGSRGSVVHAVPDLDRDGRADRVEAIFSNLKVANGIDWRNGWFYVAEQHQVSRYRAPDLATLRRSKPEVIYRDLPDKQWHGWRYARFGPDGRFYISVGAPCNICSLDGIEGTIVRMAPDGGGTEIYASGVRNSVGFDFHPVTGELYFTDNGADYMGDDSPPDELNHATAKGQWFGYPYFGGGDHRTPDFRTDDLPRKARYPVVNFGARVAALGISFYRGNAFPKEYQGDAFVAQHGSWNRSIPDGYRVMRIRFDKKTNRAVGKEIFADGFLGPGGEVLGRPVDVKEMADGSLLVSDDRESAIYRITYVGR